MKQKQEKIRELGFTLWEMLFVVGILAVFYALVIGNFGQARVSQNLKIGQNELVTNIQKARSYSLSGRQMNGFVPKFYIVRLETSANGGNPRGYAMQGIANDTNNNLDVYYDGNPNANLENSNFPQNVFVQELMISRGGINYFPSCVQVAFAAPYGKTYIDETCAINQIYTNGATLGSKANGTLTVTLVRDGSTTVRKVLVYGLSGRIEAQ